MNKAIRALIHSCNPAITAILQCLQFSVTMCLSMTFLRSSFCARPTTDSTTWPPLKSSSVGMPRIWNLNGRIRVLVDVQLADRDLAGVVGRQRVDGRRQPLAGPAPLGPEVHEDRRAGLQHASRRNCRP